MSMSMVKIDEFKKQFNESSKKIKNIDENDTVRNAFYAPSCVKEEFRGLIYAPKITKDVPVYKSSFRFLPNLDTTKPIIKVFTWSFFDQGEGIYFVEPSTDNFNSSTPDPVKIIKNMQVPDELKAIQAEFNERIKISPIYFANISLEEDNLLDEEFQKTNWVLPFKSTILSKIKNYITENKEEGLLPFGYSKVPLFSFKCNKGPGSSGDRIIPQFSDSNFIESNRKDIPDDVLSQIQDISKIIRIPTIQEAEASLEDALILSNKYAPLFNHYLGVKEELILKKA